MGALFVILAAVIGANYPAPANPDAQYIKVKQELADFKAQCKLTPYTDECIGPRG